MTNLDLQPETGVDDREIEVVQRYLLSKGITIYGQFFDVQSPDRRREAAEWLIGELKALERFANRV